MRLNQNLYEVLEEQNSKFEFVSFNEKKYSIEKLLYSGLAMLEYIATYYVIDNTISVLSEKTNSEFELILQ